MGLVPKKVDGRLRVRATAADIQNAGDSAKLNEALTVGAKAQGPWQALPLPGRGEIVGGKLAHKADEIAKLARKKGGVDDIQGELMMLEMAAKHEGQKDAEERFRKERIATAEGYRDKIVCGFIAEIERLMPLNPDMVFTVSGFTACRLIDALSASGYSAAGKVQ